MMLEVGVSIWHSCMFEAVETVQGGSGGEQATAIVYRPDIYPQFRLHGFSHMVPVTTSPFSCSVFFISL